MTTTDSPVMDFHLRLPRRLIESVDAIAVEEKRSRNRTIEIALEQYVAKAKRPEG